MNSFHMTDTFSKLIGSPERFDCYMRVVCGHVKDYVLPKSRLCVWFDQKFPRLTDKIIRKVARTVELKSLERRVNRSIQNVQNIDETSLSDLCRQLTYIGCFRQAMDIYKAVQGSGRTEYAGELLSAVARSGNVLALRKIAKDAIYSDNMPAFVLASKRAAQEGDPCSCFLLGEAFATGYLYINGPSIAKRNLTALHYFSMGLNYPIANFEQKMTTTKGNKSFVIKGRCITQGTARRIGAMIDEMEPTESEKAVVTRAELSFSHNAGFLVKAARVFNSQEKKHSAPVCIPS